jgi:Spy/CpxP family protein refolding chaperone
MNKPWQVYLVLIGIFVAGGLSGWVVANGVARRHAPMPPPPEVWIARRIEHVARELELTPEQKVHIQPIVQRTIEELDKLRRQSMPAVHGILERMETDVAKQLTPEQRTKFEHILKERREARKQLREQRGPHGEGERPHGPPPDEQNPPPPPDTGGQPPTPPAQGDKPVGT